MRNQHWFTIAGASTLIIGTVIAITTPSAKPIAVLGASTAGAVGGILLTTQMTAQQRTSSSKTKATPSSYNNTLTQFSHLENLLQQNHSEVRTELRMLNGQISQGSSSQVTNLEESSSNDSLERIERLLKQNSTELTALTQQTHQQDSSHLGSKRTAILYDIENLLKGYNISQEILASLSLKDILEEIRQKEVIGPILVQQAYANWSDTRLKIMRGEINELGIDPIQVFGFAREPKKNAADIELVISAIDLAYVRPSIEVFVIVSGDGGFASLAKKLREYGKIVIGCAYQKSASKTFQSVCDEFIWISDPDIDASQEKPIPANNPLRKKTQSSASQSALNPELKPGSKSQVDSSLHGLNLLTSSQLDEIKTLTQVQLPLSESQLVSATQSILNLYKLDSTSQSELSTSGIDLSVVYEAIKYALPTLKSSELGFTKFTDYMQYVCKDSEFCVARVSPSKVILALRNSTPSGTHVFPAIDLRDFRSEGFDPINARLIDRINQIKQIVITTHKTDAVSITQNILNLYSSDPIARSELLNPGIPLSVVQRVMKYVLPEFQSIQFGFAKFTEYMQFICKNSELCLGRTPPSNVSLLLRASIPEQATVLPDLEAREIHSMDTYRSILANGSPSYRLPSANELYAITTWIEEHPIEQTDLGTAIDDIATGLNGEISLEVIKLTLLSFLAAELFVRSPEGVQLSEQALSLREDMRSLEAIMHTLKALAHDKITAVLPTVQPDVLQQIFPDADWEDTGQSLD